MTIDRTGILALVVKQPPYAQRSARSQLDVALAAATLEIPLEIFFLNGGIWQLAAARNADAAGLPRGLKGWAAVSQMTSVTFFAEENELKKLRDGGVETVVAVEGLDHAGMAARWHRCYQVMSL